MKHKMLQGFRTHVLTIRFALTVTFLLYALWLSMTDRGDSLIEVMGLTCGGILLLMAWLHQVLQAEADRRLRPLLFGLGLELAAVIGFAALCFSSLPFRLAFPLSSSALARFVAVTNPPDGIEHLQPVGRQVGLLRILAMRRDKAGNIIFITRSGSMLVNCLVCHPKRGSKRLRHGFYVGEGWYHYSYMAW